MARGQKAILTEAMSALALNVRVRDQAILMAVDRVAANRDLVGVVLVVFVVLRRIATVHPECSSRPLTAARMAAVTVVAVVLPLHG